MPVDSSVKYKHYYNKKVNIYLFLLFNIFHNETLLYFVLNPNIYSKHYAQFAFITSIFRKFMLVLNIGEINLELAKVPRPFVIMT